MNTGRSARVGGSGPGPRSRTTGVASTLGTSRTAVPASRTSTPLCVTPPEPALKRRGIPLLAAAVRRRGFPGPASAPTAVPGTPIPTESPSERSTPVPVPTPAHHSPRAARVRRSPR